MVQPTAKLVWPPGSYCPQRAAGRNDPHAVMSRNDAERDVPAVGAPGERLDRLGHGVFARYGPGPRDVPALRERLAAWPRP
jgi:hypothetical protein